MLEPAAPRIRFRRLELSFNANDLACDLAAIGDDAWTVHFNTGYHDGGWSGVTLRGVGGDTAQLFPGDPRTASYADTPLWRRCPHIAAAIGQLPCSVGSVRLLRLSPGGHIREHRDQGLFMENGLARLHVPIRTGQQVEFYLGSDLVTMAPGECWYLNFDLPHRVQNLGATERVHLVIDCEVNDWLRGQIRTGSAVSADDRCSSQSRFERFRALVLDDPALVDALWPIESADAFTEQVLILASRHGLHFTADDVAAAMGQGRRAGAGRWIVG